MTVTCRLEAIVPKVVIFFDHILKLVFLFIYCPIQ